MKPNKWFPIIGLIITILLIFWRINDNYVSFTDELLFEETSYRMFASNPTSPFPNKNWIIPINNNQAWLEKPPLYFWLTAPVFWITNQFTNIHPLTNTLLPNGEFIYPWIRRFWTDISGVIIVILTYKIAQQLFNKKKGILAGLLLLASPLFLSTTKTASLDLTATMWMTATIYTYLKTKKTNPTNLQLLTMGIFISLGILTRSFLALTPLAIILIDQIFNKKNSWKLQQWVILIGTTFIFTFPWHYAIYKLYPQEFLQTYFGFNIIEHAVNLTPGYTKTTPFFYIKTLIINIPWLLPLTTTYILYYIYNKHTQQNTSKKTNKLQTNHKFLLIWIFLPLTLLTFSATRHEWYLIQIMPPLSILLAIITTQTYKFIQKCQTCTAVKFLAQISFFTFILASIATVLTVSDPSTSTIKTLRWAQKNIPANQPLYVYKQTYLPQTILFHPQKTILLKPKKIKNKTQKTYIFIANQDRQEPVILQLKLKPIKRFNFGNIYTTVPQLF